MRWWIPGWYGWVCLIERLVSSFRYKTYRTYWIGSMIAMVTFRIQDVALSWQILEETDSSLMLGLVAFAYGVPLLIWGPLTGVLVDHVEGHLAIGGALVAAALGSLGVAVLLFLERIMVWQIVAVSCLFGTAFTLYAPARLALLPEMVPRWALVEASTVEYSSTRLMGFLGTLLAGFLIGSKGVMTALVLQAGLFILATVVFLGTSGGGGGACRASLRGTHAGGFFAGVGYLRQNGALRAVILTGLVVVPFGMIYSRLMPVFVRDVLGGDASVLGLVLGASSLGAALSGFVIAAIASELRKGRVLLLASCAFGCGVLLFSFSTHLLVAVVLLFLVGLLIGVYLTLSNVLLQSVTPGPLRGRVMSTWGMVWGALPFASLVAGAAADVWGVRAIIGISGMVCALFSLGMILFDSPLNELR